MKNYFTGFSVVMVLIFAALGGMQAYNIVRYGVESVPLVLNDAIAGAIREQRQFLAIYQASAEPDSNIAMQVPKKKK